MRILAVVNLSEGHQNVADDEKKALRGFNGIRILTFPDSELLCRGGFQHGLVKCAHPCAEQEPRVYPQARDGRRVVGGRGAGRR